MKRKQITCRCPAYNFPHREGGGKCEMPEHCIAVEGEGFAECGYCEMDDKCIYQDRARHSQYDPREEALTIQERNPGWRTWK